jgi:hypothetical protein
MTLPRLSNPDAACAQTNSEDLVKNRPEVIKRLGYDIPSVIKDVGTSIPELNEIIEFTTKTYNKTQDILESNDLQELYDNSQMNFDNDIQKIRLIMTARDFFKSATTDSGTSRDSSFNELFAKPMINADFDKMVKIYKEGIDYIKMTYPAIKNSATTNFELQEKITDINDMYITRINDVKDEYAMLSNVDERKNFYITKDQEFFNNMLYWVRIIYFVVLVVYIVLGDVFFKKRYLDYRFYIFLIIYIALPFIFKYIVGYISILYNKVIEFFNLKSPVYSYTDLVTLQAKNNMYVNPVGANGLTSLQ